MWTHDKRLHDLPGFEPEQFRGLQKSVGYRAFDHLDFEAARHSIRENVRASGEVSHVGFTFA